MSSPTCPVCDTVAGTPFLELRDIPVQPNALWNSREGALSAVRGNVVLALCDRCGMIWNTVFDPALLEYTVDYENSLHFSPAFQSYAESLAQRLIESYDVRRKAVVEIGCGKGEFLAMVCGLGGNTGVGFDPSYEGESDLSADGHIRFVQDYYTEQTAIGHADLLVCRHVLEHVADPLSFLRSVRRSIASTESVLYLEVPAGDHLLRTNSVWDVIYPHCSVFTANALRAAVERSGFAVIDQGHAFGDQYLWVEARAAGTRPASAEGGDRLAEFAQDFAQSYQSKQARWNRLLSASNGKGIVVWGAGAKGAMFLNLVAEADRVSVVVDVNPRKHGAFVPGTGHEIVPPEALSHHPPRSVVAMNPLYRAEIEKSLRGLDLPTAVEVA